jgi:hypothetical protein
MSRRLTGALLCALALFLVPAAASAQAPDDHAAARAFADITMRAVADMEAVTAGSPEMGAPRCPASRRFEKRASEEQKEAMYELYATHFIGRLTRAMTPVLARTVSDLYAVPTADPVLQKGRGAWRRVHEMYAGFAAFPHVHICAEMRRYVRSDFHRTRLMRAAHRFFRRADRWDTSGIDRAMNRAEKRLVELGVPADDADAFDGEIEHSGGRGEARAAQAPAPRSPLTALRAAR